MITGRITTFLLICVLAFYNFAENKSECNASAVLNISESLLKQQNLTQAFIDYDKIRSLDEINSNAADAFPWISNDGLRIYYTKSSKPNLNSFIVFSKRTHIDSLFQNPDTLSINNPKTWNMCPWLTDDELNIFFTRKHFKGSPLYYSKRNNIHEEFGTPTPIELLGYNVDKLQSPSFSQDLKQLFIIPAGKVNNKQILIFNRINEQQYSLENHISIPLKYAFGSGELSSDGLAYFASITRGGKSLICVLERDSLHQNFESLSTIENELINDTEYSNIAPSISDDGQYLAFTRPIKSFGFNSLELFIASKKNSK